MANFFNTNVDALLRNDLERAYENMCFGSNFSAIFGLFRKEDRDGDAVKVPLVTDFGAGQSATAATAYANATLAGRYAFVVTPFVTYGSSIVPLNQAAFTKGDDNSVVDLLLDESQKCMDSVNMQFDTALSASGYGELGTISSNSGSGPSYTLVLDQTSSANHVTVGATYQTKATPTTGTLDTGSFTVTNVATATKTLVVTSNSSWAPTNGHVFGLQGTIAASSSPIQWPGIPGWIPPASARPISLSDSFFSVNRSANETKLAGLYLDGTAMGILEGINQLAYAVADVPGANPDLVVMSYQNLGKVNAQLQTERRYVEDTVKGPGIDVFFRTVSVNGPRGKMDIVASSNFASNLVAILDKASWVLGAPGNRPIVPATPDGNPVQNVPGTDTAVILYRGQAFVYCDAPGHNGMLTVKAS
jgi:hypothetical protein